MTALDVLPLAAARAYLNIDTGEQDDELTSFIAPAVARVVRHTGHPLEAAADASPLELLACKVVLADFWRTQRVSGPGRGGYGGAAGPDPDTGIGGPAPLRVRLTDLLGPAAADGDTVPQPVGNFPSPLPAPDLPGPSRLRFELW